MATKVSSTPTPLQTLGMPLLPVPQEETPKAIQYSIFSSLTPLHTLSTLTILENVQGGVTQEEDKSEKKNEEEKVKGEEEEKKEEEKKEEKKNQEEEKEERKEEEKEEDPKEEVSKTNYTSCDSKRACGYEDTCLNSSWKTISESNKVKEG